MDYGYSTLIEEVQITNDLLTETNEHLEEISTNSSFIIILLVCVLALKSADMIHHLVDACFKRR